VLGREPINLQGFRLARVRYSPDSDQIPQRGVMSGRAMYARRPRCKENLTYLRSVRVQPCIRPVFRVEARPPPARNCENYQVKTGVKHN
jgi:hypothetical protein